jgi:putative transposase
MEISTATFYGWRTKFGSPKRQTKPSGKAGALMSRLKELEAENVRLKKMQMQESIKAQMLKEAQGGK